MKFTVAKGTWLLMMTPGSVARALAPSGLIALAAGARCKLVQLGVQSQAAVAVDHGRHVQDARPAGWFASRIHPVVLSLPGRTWSTFSPACSLGKWPPRRTS